MEVGRARPRVDDCVPLRLGVLLFVLYLVTANYGHQSVDTASAALPAYQLATHGNLYMDDFAHLPLWWVHVDGGHIVSNRLPGPTLFAAPFYLLIRLPGPTYLPAAVAAATAAALSAVVLYLLVRGWVGRRVALAAALTLALATPTWSVSADALWTHGVGQLVLLGAIWAVSRRRWWLAGALCGTAVLVRPHYAVIGLAVAGFLVVVERRWRAALVIGAGVAVGIAALVLYNAALFGSPSVSNGYATAGLGSPARNPLAMLGNTLGAFISPSRGLFLYTPFVLVLLPGLATGWRAAPQWAKVAALAGAAYLVTQLALIRFSGGYGFFPYRTTIEPLTLCAPLLISVCREWVVTAWRRAALLVSLAIAAALTVVAATIPLPRRTSDPDYWGTSELTIYFERYPVATVAGLCAGAAAVVAVAVVLSRRPQRDAPEEPGLATQEQAGVVA